MGLFDPPADSSGILGFNAMDPRTYQTLGLLSGVGEASAPSRLPVTKGMVLGDLAKGMMGGFQAGNVGALQNVNMQLALQNYGLVEDYLNHRGLFAPQGQLPATPQAQPPAGSPSQSSIAVNPASYLKTTANLESSGGTTAPENPYGFKGPTADQYGGSGSVEALRLAANNAEVFRKKMGRDPTPSELYLMHQQGAAGATALLSNPDARAIDALTPIYGDPMKAHSAITANGGTPDMTAGQFAQMWAQRYSKGDAQTIAPAPQPAVPQTAAPAAPPNDYQALGRAMVMDRLVPGAGKAQLPGPTDFMRSYNDFVNAPPDLKPLALQKVMTAAGDRYQLMRNGWAYDRVTNQWMHMPELGVGVTGGMGPNGQITANVVPGELGALEQTHKAIAGGQAAYEPLTVHDAAGNEYIVPKTALQPTSAPTSAPASRPLAFKSAPAAPTTGLPAGTTGADVLRGAGSPSPASPNTPVQMLPEFPKRLDDFMQELGPQYAPPSRPTGPEGSLLGAPGTGITELQKGDAERLQGYAKEAAGGQKVYTNLQQLYQIIGGGLSTGKMTDAATSLANYAQQAGYGKYVPAKFDPSDAGAFNKLATDLVFAQLKQIGGRPMMSEIEGLRQANPNTSLTPQANVEILNNLLADQRWKDARADLGKQYMTRFGSLGDFDARFNETYPQYDVFNAITQKAAESGWHIPGDLTTPRGMAAAAKETPMPKKTTAAYTDEDVAHTAKLYGVTTDQVKSLLGSH